MATDSVPNRGPEIIAATVTTWLLAIVTTGLRVLSRKLKRNTFWLDDWLIIIALVWTSSHTLVMAVYQVNHGFGKHIQDGPPDAAYAWALGLFIGELTYFTGLVLVKCAILAFYWRIFHTVYSIRLRIWSLFGIIVAWGIASIVASLLKCQPVDSNWARYTPGNPMPPSEFRCVKNGRPFFYGSVIPNIITDILLFAFPTPYIIKTRLPLSQKFGLAGIFLLGALIVLISAIRFSYTLKMDSTSPDVTWNYVDTSMWSVIEQNLAVVCACLPSLKPLFTLVINGTLRSKSDITKGSSALSRTKHDTVVRSQFRNQKAGAEGGIPTSQPGQSKARGDGDTDEHPFVWLTENDSDPNFNATKGDPVTIELQEIPAESSCSVQHGAAV